MQNKRGADNLSKNGQDLWPLKREKINLSVKGMDVKQKSNMKIIDSMAFGKNNSETTVRTSPLINEESFSKLKRTHTYLKEQGVKPASYDTTITSCGSCGNWSPKQ